MNILVPTDFSEVANVALQYAAMLAQKLDAKLILMHVVPPHTMWWSLAGDNLVNDARKRQENIKAKLIRKGIDTDKIELQVFYQFPLNEWINDFVTKNRIDFAVIGTSGAGLKRTIMGSFALGMIEHLSVPVIAVPEGSKMKTISHILYPVDLEDQEEEIKTLLAFAKTFDAFIHMVHISDNETQEKSIAAEKLRKMAVEIGYEKITTNVKTGFPIESMIEESIREKNADLLVMFPKKKGFFKQVFKGSVTEEISHKITIPLLAIKQHKKAGYPEHADF